MSASSSGGQVEITKTVAEWNEERRKLGLKPLRTEDDSGNLKEGTSEAPLDHWVEKQKKDSTRIDPKLVAAEDKRKRERAKLATGRGLADILDDEPEDLRKWTSSHQSTVSSNRERNERRLRKAQEKESRDAPKLDNFRVTHELEDFQEGEQAILTLADERVINADGTLNEDMDMLEDITKMDAFKLKQREERLKLKASYDPARGNHGDSSANDVLTKYDEQAARPTGFTVAESQSAEAERKLREMSAALNAPADTSNDGTTIGTLKFQSDMMDAQEEVKFRKKLAKQAKKQFKKAGLNKREAITADEEDDEALGGGTMGGPKKVQRFARQMDLDSDEDDPELYEQLRKQKVAAKKDTGKQMKRVQELLRDEDDMVKDVAGKNVEFLVSATTEFCKTVQTHEEKDENTKRETFKGMEMFKQEQQLRLKLNEESKMIDQVNRQNNPHQSASSSRAKGTAGGASSSSAKQIGAPEKQVEELLHERPLDGSVHSALVYLRERNGFGNDQFSHSSNSKRDGGVLEMETGEGAIKLEYRDEFGRVNTAKEMFRQISWNFHGKKHGAKNAERRKQKLEEEGRIKKKDLNAPPTLQALQAVQKKEKKPYMTLG